ncbi:hypothetical protein AGABI2DRAFT_119105 [Agaricus bisporus var. bisporus H97]|uniref:hypothetical protein n=1 Tax=Agaricus bisporus var. bisporus (strain H97 / ATCC MYA-4626 / FGSC 10389) TaxID=936046 RepID=UPI00029F5F3F|nr:hypothetical protein AGABI2DRAFT_119105 [Agaricus bisporus var. bisporus H97]EKV46929.1 hypothetical protein AGABI2DRAFT_119105 [Agaricus bisporus var. bisporus H97]
MGAVGQLSNQPLSREALENGVRDVISDFLLKTNQTPKAPGQPDAPVFERECWAEADRRGYDMHYLSKHLPVGILISNATFFYHSFELKLYVAYYSGILLCVDDNYDTQSRVDGIARFMERYQRGERHPTDILNNLADLLAETGTYFDPVATNLIMCATFSFMNAMVIENITAGMKIPSQAKRYPDCLRQFSGISKAYAAFIFRPSVSAAQYIHALPELEDIINYVNDIASFYKEELAGEDGNAVSLLAKLNNRSKLDQLRVLSDGVAESHRRTLEILKGRDDAERDYLLFWSGYIPFHLSTTRYRLMELGFN